MACTDMDKLNGAIECIDRLVTKNSIKKVVDKVSEELFEYNKKLFADIEFIKESGNGWINVKLPDGYEKIPHFDLSSDHHHVLTVSEQKRYFEDLRNSKLRITCINGDYTSSLSNYDTEYWCDSCQSIFRTMDYYRCSECNTDICPQCYENKSILEYHGSNHHVAKKPRVRNISFFCHICSEKIDHNSERYSDFPCYGSDYYACVCMSCSSTPSGRKNVISHSLIKHDYQPDFNDYSGFGSLLDWIPTVRDKYGDMILVNINSSSPNYQAVCLSSADIAKHRNYAIVKSNINQIMKLVEKYDHIDDDEFKDFQVESTNWYRYYMTPIKRIMLLHNFPVYHS